MRLRCFDGLRAVAIILVIASHAKSTWHFDLPAVLDSVIGNGGAGVRCFFVISGYLITFLLIKEMQKTGKIGLGNFYARRALRIFPAFFTYLALMWYLNWAGIIDVSAAHLFSATTFTWNYSHLWVPQCAADCSYIGHFWSLSLEEQYYLVWPLSLLFFGLFGNIRLSLALIVAMPFIRVATYFLMPDSRGQLAMMFHTAIDPILIGSVGALLMYGKRVQFNQKKFQSKSLCCFCIAFVLVLSPIASASELIRGYDIIFGITLEASAFLYIIIWLQTSVNNRLSWFLELKPVAFIGTISYSLYLWQQPFLNETNQTWMGAWPLNLVLVLLAACTSYYVIEKPFLKIRDAIKAQQGHPVTYSRDDSARRSSLVERV